jgi:hypothetical protein
MSSHDLLEDFGLIHTTATDAGDNHDAADGLCQLPQGAFQLQVFHAPQVSFLPIPPLEACVHASISQQANRALVNPSPPDIPVAWQFSYRAALPARAPSLTF